MAEQKKNQLEPEKAQAVVEAKAENKAVAKAETEAKKPVKKQNFFVRTGHSIVKWFRDLKSEAKKVVWPTGKQVTNNTIIVIIAIVVVAVFVAILDVSFGFVRDLIARLV